MADNKQGPIRTTEQTTVAGQPNLTCGIVMPISPIEGYSAEHWAEVKEILTQAIETAGFEGRMVSEADDVGSIHKRIIQNLYDDPIVVCDVSAKNSNVMFELGMRLAFDKPTIIVKDDKTTYSFDTSSIEHIDYPRDLRFSKINEFKEKLSYKIKATYDAAKNDSNYTTFLKHFGEFTVAKIDKKEVTKEDFLIGEMRELRSMISKISKPEPIRAISVDLEAYNEESLKRINKGLREKFSVYRVTYKKLNDESYRATIYYMDENERDEITAHAKFLSDEIPF